eukprot:scaffold43373_cov87-Cyclotella_meneghiniana.AAC.1
MSDFIPPTAHSASEDDLKHFVVTTFEPFQLKWNRRTQRPGVNNSIMIQIQQSATKQSSKGGRYEDSYNCDSDVCNYHDDPARR